MSVKSLRRHEGHLMIDHRACEGIPDQLAVASGLPPGAGKGLFESACYTCSHCQRIQILNPDRSRERAYCRGCDHLICDRCGLERARTGQCKTYAQKIDELLILSGV